MKARCEHLYSFVEPIPVEEGSGFSPGIIAFRQRLARVFDKTPDGPLPIIGKPL
jgi:hypothetical protein